jgi:hypothetical protein
MAAEKNYLVVVHGIGEHTEASVKKDVKSVLSKISPGFNKNVETHAVVYNQVFKDWIATAKSDWNAAIDKLASTNHFTGAKDLLKKKLGNDNQDFLETHALDVALYLSTVGVKVQLEVALQLTELLQAFIAGGDTRNRRIVILGHSMGTAVVHDTLHKMIQGGFEDDRANNLANMSLRINSLYQVANTSRLLKTTIDPTTVDTSVRPYPGGIIDRMYNVNHKFDPVPRVKPFKVDAQRWLPETPYPDSMYQDIELKAVLDQDIHSLKHYLRDPRLHMPLLFELDRDFDLPRNFRAKQVEYDKTTKKLIEARLKKKVDAAKAKLADSARDVILAFLDNL